MPASKQFVKSDVQSMNSVFVNDGLLDVAQIFVQAALSPDISV